MNGEQEYGPGGQHDVVPHQRGADQRLSVSLCVPLFQDLTKPGLSSASSVSRGVFSSVWKCFWVCAVGASREQPAVAVLWAVRTAVSADDNDPTWSQSLNCTVSPEEVCYVSALRTVRVSCYIPDQHHLVGVDMNISLKLGAHEFHPLLFAVS